MIDDFNVVRSFHSATMVKYLFKDLHVVMRGDKWFTEMERAQLKQGYNYKSSIIMAVNLM